MYRRIRDVFRKISPRRTSPLVSVVIKSFNHAKYIAETIDSVLAQTMQDFEIVLTDDGSTDDTVKVIERYLDDPRIRFQGLPVNLGIPHALNVSIARARAPFIAILNSDDYTMPARLESQIAYLDTHQAAAAVFSQPRCVDEAGNHIADWPVFSVPLSFPDFSQATWLRHFFLEGNYLCAPSALIRTSALRAVGPYDRRLTNLSDLDMWVRMLNQGELHVLPDRLTAFRIRDDNANLSAPRPDAQLRTVFEYSEILKHYLGMDENLLRSVFKDFFVQSNLDQSLNIQRLLAEVALQANQPAHRLFGVQTLFNAARTDEDFRRLRDVTGSLNILGINIEPGLRLT